MGVRVVESDNPSWVVTDAFELGLSNGDSITFTEGESVGVVSKEDRPFLDLTINSKPVGIRLAKREFEGMMERVSHISEFKQIAKDIADVASDADFAAEDLVLAYKSAKESQSDKSRKSLPFLERVHTLDLREKARLVLSEKTGKFRETLRAKSIRACESGLD